MSRNPRPVPRIRVVPSVGACLLAFGVNSLWGVNVASADSAASSGPLEVALRYEASADCPEREAFLELVRVRAPHVRLLDHDSAPPLAVVVALGEHPRGAAGQAKILLDGRERDTREFLGATCLEVARAAAISVSFVLETWSVQAPAPEQSAAKEQPAAPEQLDAPAESPPNDGDENEPPPFVSDRSRVSASEGAAPLAVRFDVGLTPLAASLLDKPWLVGAGLSFGARFSHASRPSARVSALGALSDGATSSYRWLVGEALVCAFGVGDEWSVSPCAQGLAGVLRAEGEAIDFPADVTVPWFAVGPALRGSVSLGASTRLVASVAASVPLAQRSFVFERPRRAVTQTRSVGWLVAVGVEHDLGGS